MYVRAIQGHSGGELIAPELMNYVAVPLRWKELKYHVGSSFTVSSILQAGLIVVGKDSTEGWQTDTEERYDDGLSKPRTVHYNNKWKISQDVVHCVNLRKNTTERITVLEDTNSCHYPS